MKWATPEYKRVRLTSIRCDVADIRRRMKEPHVIELAADIAASGEAPIHAPTIRVDTGALVCGRDRMAALMVNKAKSAWVHRGEFTEAEAKEMELRENIYRRQDNRTELLARLVAVREREIQAEQDDARARGETVSEANRDSPKAKARRDIARKAGVTPAAIKKAEQRAAAAEPSGTSSPNELTEEEANAGGKIELPAGFKAFDLDVPLAGRSAIAETATWFGDMAQTMNNLLRELAEMEKQGGYAAAPVHIQKIREAFQAAGHAVREAIPASLCFYCKAQPAVTPNCHPCGGTGVVGRHGGDNVPPEAKLVGDKARVAVDGKWVLVGAAGNAAEAAPPAKKGKSIKVRREDGQEIPLDDIPLPTDDEELAF